MAINMYLVSLYKNKITSHFIPLMVRSLWKVKRNKQNFIGM